MGKRAFEEKGRVVNQKDHNESIRPPPRRVYNFDDAHFDKLSANRAGQAQCEQGRLYGFGQKGV